MTEERFHFIDILGLHLELPLSLPSWVLETRGALPLLHHLTGVHLPVPEVYSHQVIRLCQHHLRLQFPWLRGIAPPRHLVDSAQLWAWVDVLQRRLAPPGTDGGRVIPVEPLVPGTVQYHPVAIPLAEVMRQLGFEPDLPEDDG